MKRPPLARSVGLFLSAIARSPRRMGAVLPSSRFLARAMAAQVDAARAGWVIELGAGTGVVTHALLEAGVKPDKLLVVERDPRLCEGLSRHFPQAKVVGWDALQLADNLAALGGGPVNAVVSSLPLLSMPAAVQEAIVGQMFAVLKGAGPLIQFTYGPKSSISGAQQRVHHVTGRPMKRIFRNVPPATVWKYE